MLQNIQCTHNLKFQYIHVYKLRQLKGSFDAEAYKKLHSLFFMCGWGLTLASATAGSLANSLVAAFSYSGANALQ